MQLSWRFKVLSGVAAAILGYLIFVPDSSQTVEAAGAGQRRAMPPAIAKPTQNSHGTDKKGRRLLADISGSSRLVKDTVAEALFSAHSWYVAPPPPPPSAPVAPPPPPAPTAPPLPFAFMGSYKSQEGIATFYLTAGDRVYDVKVGDTLDNTYSIDGVKSGQLLLTYMPLKIQQSLAVGDE